MSKQPTPSPALTDSILKAPDVLNIDADLGPDTGPETMPAMPFGHQTYGLREGETLREVAGRHGMTAEQLQRLNPDAVPDTRVDPATGTNLRVPRAITMGGYKHGLLFPFMSGGAAAGAALAALRQRSRDRDAKARRAAGDESAKSEGVNLLSYLGGGALGGAVLSVLAKKLLGPAVEGSKAWDWDDVRRWVRAYGGAAEGMGKESALGKHVAVSAVLAQLMAERPPKPRPETISVPVHVEFEDDDAEAALGERGLEIVRRLEMKSAANPLSLAYPAMGAAFFPGAVRDTAESAAYGDMPGAVIGAGSATGLAGMAAPALGSGARWLGGMAARAARPRPLGGKVRGMAMSAARSGKRFAGAASRFGKFSGPVYWAAMLAGVMRDRRQGAQYARQSARQRYAPGGWGSA